MLSEAGYHGIVALSACSTFPVSASTTSSASACAICGVAMASIATARIHFNDGRSGRGKYTTVPVL
ncbi:hypothetical protein ACVWW1_005488 [Bradyrhizobium sp. JR3.5]